MAKRRQKAPSVRKPGQSPSKPAVPLYGELAEFRDALNAEVESAKKASSSSAVPLANGRRIGTSGAGYQYQFEIESALDVPGDTPGELRVPHLEPIRVSLVAFEGLSVIINAEKDLGSFVPFATLQSDLSMLLLKLIERIETKSVLPNPAGSRLLGKHAPTGTLETITNERLGLSGDRLLNPEQLEAVGSVLGRDTTYIWGPPGTGKTHTIGAIGAELFKRGQSLLLVSHTNTAIDGAILQIAKALRHVAPAELEAGLVIRIGTPKDQRFKTPENSMLLLSEQRERRMGQLVAQRDLLQAERDTLRARERELNVLVELHEWLAEAEPDITRMQEAMTGLTRLRDKVESLRVSVKSAESGVAALTSSTRDAKTALWAKEHEVECRSELQSLETRRDAMKQELAETEAWYSLLETHLPTARELQPSRDELARCPSLNDAAHAVAARAKERNTRENQLGQDQQALDATERLLAETSAVNWITRKWKGLPEPDAQRALVARAKDKVATSTLSLGVAVKAYQDAESMRARVEQLTAIIAPHSALPTLPALLRDLGTAATALNRLRPQCAKAERARDEASAELESIRDTLTSFRAQHRCEPEGLLERFRAEEQNLQSFRALLQQQSRQEQAEAERLHTELLPRLRLLRELDLLKVIPDDLGEMVIALEGGIQSARRRTTTKTKSEAQAEQNALIDRLRVIAAELERIEEALRRVEESIIREARVVGATLTASFLRDAIQNRRFDTVLLDEASMAAIPALWTAASVADRALVVVGDYRQLPPVVVSEHELARKWLGRDPFQLVGLSHDGPKPDWFVGLKEQRRMHPDISRIANTLIYNCLTDHPEMLNREQAPIEWLSPDWPFHDPVLLVDTEPLHAWVTSVSRGGGNSSRLNFMSATVCADIASRMLSASRSAWNRTAYPRILVIAPYRPHAKLVSLLLRDDHLEPEVVSGTIHGFQGSQADVVILDLVNDEPHWRVGHFVPDYDDITIRAFNVAITRAMRRLIVVGDFKYCTAQGRKAFIGSKLLPFLQDHYPLANALSVVPAGLASRAAQARIQVFGGPVELPHERTVVSQDRFYTLLAQDLLVASSRVVIYSPFITQARLAEIETHLKGAIDRGVPVTVVTKPLDDRDKRDRSQYRTLELALSAWNVQVVHKRGMHEKLVLIDSSIVWTGSLNPLSFRGTQEIMERRHSTQVFEEYAKTLRLDELLAAFQTGAPRCPICGEEVGAAEGSTTPFYWRCTDSACAFRRGLDDDSLRDGEVKCKRCGQDVKLLEKDKDGRARWVCEANDRHKQLVQAMHLQLPKVRERLTAAKLARLERRLATESKRSRKGGETLFG